MNLHQVNGSVVQLGLVVFEHEFFLEVHQMVVCVVVGGEVVEGLGRVGEMLNEDDELGQADDFV
jgi:hypothetical protein